tara:strand:- start:147 stop:311 length:165 start_codon:yes stop_codon:yes gene_type:complete
MNKTTNSISSKKIFDDWLDKCPTKITHYREYSPASDDMNPEVVVTFELKEENYY